MDYKEQLKRKTISQDDAVWQIPDNAYLFTYGFGEPVGLLSRLTQLKGKRRNIT